MALRPFAEIYRRACERKGGAEAVEAGLPSPKPTEVLAALEDSRWLAGMTRSIFQAGFSWKVVESKWPGFEEAFWGFDPGRCAMLSDEDLDRLLADRGIIRNARKILAVRDNAIFLGDLAREHGSAGKAIAGWPDSDFIGLIALLKKRASRLGGNSGPYFLRQMGRDGWVHTQSVTAALVHEGVVTKTPTSKRDLAAVQQAFDAWKAESGRPLMQISRVLALSVDG